jgi:hypothetical protein
MNEDGSLGEQTPKAQPGRVPVVHLCEICGEFGAFGYGPPGLLLQPAERWFCREHREEGERRWAARYGRVSTQPASIRDDGPARSVTALDGDNGEPSVLTP